MLVVQAQLNIGAALVETVELVLVLVLELVLVLVVAQVAAKLRG